MTTTASALPDPRPPIGIWRPWELNQVLVEELPISQSYAWRLFVPGQYWELYLAPGGCHGTWELCDQPVSAQAKRHAIGFTAWQLSPQPIPRRIIADGPPQTLTALERIADGYEQAQIANQRAREVVAGSRWEWHCLPGITVHLEIGAHQEQSGPIGLKIKTFWLPVQPGGAPLSEIQSLVEAIFPDQTTDAVIFVLLAESGMLVPMTDTKRLPWVP